MGASTLQIRQQRGRRKAETAVRPVLHQKYVCGARSADHVSDHQNCAAWPRRAMKWVFWISAALIGFTYLGYPLWLYLRCRLRPRPVARGPFHGSLSLIMVVRNEAATLRRKLENLLALSCPAERREIILVSDGSTDQTGEILSSYAALPEVRVLLRPQAEGKAVGLNQALQLATSDLVVFTDARQIIEPEALTRLTENFADPEVGCASGELMLGDPVSGESGKGVGLYWRVEKKVREMESESGSVAGATGAFYAA